MSSKKIILLILLSSTVAIKLSAESFSLGPIVNVDVRDVDYTIQALPEADIEEDSICLWDGDEILTFSMPELSRSIEKHLSINWAKLAEAKLIWIFERLSDHQAD